MAEPTLLQQARGLAAHAQTFRDVCSLADAVLAIADYLEQQHAAMSGPAQVPGELRCKRCGASSMVIGLSCNGEMGHDFGPAQVPGDPTLSVDRQEEPLLWFESQEEFDEAARARVAELDATRARLTGMQSAIDDAMRKALDKQGISLTDALDLDELQRLCDAATCERYALFCEWWCDEKAQSQEAIEAARELAERFRRGEVRHA